MDLDGLKDIWQSVSAKEAAQSNVSQAEIKELLKGKTKNTLNKIWQSILMEIYISAFMMIALLIFALVTKNALAFLVFFVVLVLTTVSFIYFAGKFKRIFKLSRELSADNLLSSLRKLTSILIFYIKVYFILGIASLPLGLLVGFLYAKYESQDFSTDGRELLILFITMIVMSAILYPLLRLYLKALYGKYINQLKAYLVELEG